MEEKPRKTKAQDIIEKINESLQEYNAMKKEVFDKIELNRKAIEKVKENPNWDKSNTHDYEVAIANALDRLDRIKNNENVLLDRILDKLIRIEGLYQQEGTQEQDKRPILLEFKSWGKNGKKK